MDKTMLIAMIVLAIIQTFNNAQTAQTADPSVVVLPDADTVQPMVTVEGVAEAMLRLAQEGKV